GVFCGSRFAREVRIEAELLRQIAELAPDELRILERVGAVERDLTGGRLEQAGDDAHERRLARAVRTEESEHSGRHGEAHALERGDGSGVDLDEIAKDEH